MSAPENPPTPRSGVPNELLDQMHEATQKLGDARHHREQAEDSNFDIEKKRDQASAEIRQVEQRLERIDREITKELEKS